MDSSSKEEAAIVAAELPPLPARTSPFARFWANANTQVVLVSLVCFGCPGTYAYTFDDAILLTAESVDATGMFNGKLEIFSQPKTLHRN